MPFQQFGHGGKLYVGSAVLTGRPTTGTHYNNATWTEWTRVRDVSMTGAMVNVDNTTRDEAARGWSTTIKVVTQPVLTFEVLWRPNDSVATPNEALLDQLLVAWANNTLLALMELDQARTVNGAQGMVGNWSVEIDRRGPVQGVYLFGVTARLSEFGDWVEYNGTTLVAKA